MAASFPLPLADFTDRLILSGMTLHCPVATTEARSAKGEIIRGQRGAALWQGGFSLEPVKPGCGRSIQVLVDLLSETGASFLVGPRGYRPEGLAGQSIRLASVAGNNRDITLTGLPGGYQIRPGDYLSFVYGGVYAFHQSVFGATASGAGQAGLEVFPHIRPGWVANSVIEMVAPKFKALIRESSPGPIAFSRRQRPIIAEGASFEFIQTLR